MHRKLSFFAAATAVFGVALLIPMFTSLGSDQETELGLASPPQRVQA